MNVKLSFKKTGNKKNHEICRSFIIKSVLHREDHTVITAN